MVIKKKIWLVSSSARDMILLNYYFFSFPFFQSLRYRKGNSISFFFRARYDVAIWLVNYCFFFFFEGETGGCGITDDVVEWMDRIQNSAEPDEERPVTEKKSDPPPVVKPWNGDQESPGHKYSREANEPSHRRTRRATRPKEDKKNNTCSLFIQTDPLIWRHISEQVDIKVIRAQNISLFILSGSSGVSFKFS